MGIALFIAVGYICYIIFGGIRRIGTFSAIIVPVMATLYIGVALYIMIINIRLVPHMFALIFSNALGLKQVAGGTHPAKQGLI